jgi:sec-independent protein translocase protein TatA
MGFGSPLHWLVVGLVLLLLFGNRLPSVMRSLGLGIVEFKKGLQGIQHEIDGAAAPKDPDKEKIEQEPVKKE